MMQQKPKAKFKVGQQAEHKVRYYVKGKEKIKWEKVTILERKLFASLADGFDWAYRISNSIFPTFECESEFRAVQFIVKEGSGTQ